MLAHAACTRSRTATKCSRSPLSLARVDSRSCRPSALDQARRPMATVARVHSALSESPASGLPFPLDTARIPWAYPGCRISASRTLPPPPSRLPGQPAVPADLSLSRKRRWTAQRPCSVPAFPPESAICHDWPKRRSFALPAAPPRSACVMRSVVHPGASSRPCPATIGAGGGWPVLAGRCAPRLCHLSRAQLRHLRSFPMRLSAAAWVEGGRA